MSDNQQNDPKLPLDASSDDNETISNAPSAASHILADDTVTGEHTQISSSSRGESDAVFERLAEQRSPGQRYRIENEIGRGGMGVILRVFDEDLNRAMAMKVVLGSEQEGGTTETRNLAPELLGRFFDEARVTGQLVHPGIVPVHELGIDDTGRAYFTMQLVEGRDLRAILDLVNEEREGWTRTRALGVMLKVCEAMAYAHSKGVIHRDLKPANIMVGRFGEVYVMDWGLARVLNRPEGQDDESWVDTKARPYPGSASQDDLDSCEARTLDGNVIGTPAYMSPEQARGRVSELDARTDVYSVGALLYELLSGHRPYTSEKESVSARSILTRAHQGPPAPLASLRRDIAPELIAICECAMARDPHDRYADMGELSEDLRAYLENRVVQAYQTGAVAELKKVQSAVALQSAGAPQSAVALQPAGCSLARRRDQQASQCNATGLVRDYVLSGADAERQLGDSSRDVATHIGHAEPGSFCGALGQRRLGGRFEQVSALEALEQREREGAMTPLFALARRLRSQTARHDDQPLLGVGEACQCLTNQLLRRIFAWAPQTQPRRDGTGMTSVQHD